MLELARARHALQYLKSKLEEQTLMSLIHEDLDKTTRKAEQWALQSNGEWKSGSVVIVMSSISAERFHAYFMGMMRRRDEIALRIAHPDHYRNKITDSGPEIIENIGEDLYPWHVFGEFCDAKLIPATQVDGSYSIGFGLAVKSKNGRTIGYANHEMKDYEDGMKVKLTIVLPRSAEERLIRGHLNHFMVEFRNWYGAALSDAQ